MTVAPETMSHEELVSGYKALFASHEELTTSHEELVKRFEELTIQNAWLCKELFGKRSERRVEPSSDARQLFLGEEYKPSETEPTKKTKVGEYERTHRKAEIKFTEEDSRLKFDERVPSDDGITSLESVFKSGIVFSETRGSASGVSFRPESIAGHQRP